jgi:hypothetical protein
MAPPRTVLGEAFESAVKFLKVSSSVPEQRKPNKGRQSLDALFWEDLTTAKKNTYPKVFQARIHHGKLGISRMSWHCKVGCSLCSCLVSHTHTHTHTHTFVHCRSQIS